MYHRGVCLVDNWNSLFLEDIKAPALHLSCLANLSSMLFPHLAKAFMIFIDTWMDYITIGKASEDLVLTI